MVLEGPGLSPGLPPSLTLYGSVLPVCIGSMSWEGTPSGGQLPECCSDKILVFFILISLFS
jgi:hypothetical protein